MRWPWQDKKDEGREGKMIADTINAASVKSRAEALIDDIRANLDELSEVIVVVVKEGTKESDG